MSKIELYTEDGLLLCSASRLDMAQHCGERYRRYYIEGEGENLPTSYPIVGGKAVHRSVAQDLKLRMGALDFTHDLVPPEEFFNMELEDSGLQGRFADEHRDKAVEMARYHATHLAPSIHPVAVEAGFELRISLPFEDQWEGQLASGLEERWKESPPPSVAVRGVIDCVDAKPAGEVIVDHKTTAKKPERGQAEKSTQLPLYALARETETGRTPYGARLDFLSPGQPVPLVMPNTGNDPWGLMRSPQGTACEIWSETWMQFYRPGEGDKRAVLTRIEAFAKMHETGAFVPATTDAKLGGWKCSQKWCPFYDTCKYARAPVSVTNPYEPPPIVWREWEREEVTAGV